MVAGPGALLLSCLGLVITGEKVSNPVKGAGENPQFCEDDSRKDFVILLLSLPS